MDFFSIIDSIKILDILVYWVRTISQCISYDENVILRKLVKEMIDHIAVSPP